MAEMVLVTGLDSINRSLSLSGEKISGGLRQELSHAAEPVKAEAERLAKSDISGMKRRRKSEWAEQRVGQTVREVYVAPRARGDRKRRDGKPDPHKFVRVMLGKSYEPAFARTEPFVRASVDGWLTRIVKEV